MAKNLFSRPILVYLVQIWAQKFFLRVLPLLDIWRRQSLDILVSFHHVQDKKKTNIQS